MLTVSADQDTFIPANGRITGHGKRSFEWFSNYTVKKTSFRTGWLRNDRLKLKDRTPSRTGRLMRVGTEISTFVESRFHSS